MCTLALAYRVFPSFLVVAANRDELYERAATGPRRWADEPFVAPRDEVAGGTWLGVSKAGLFVGVTNRFGATRDPARASRGELVVEALRATSATALHAALKDLSPSRFNAFHLAYADADGAFVTWSDGERLAQGTLVPGVHVITERSHGAADAARAERIASFLGHLPTERDPEVETLAAVLRTHDEQDRFRASCVHFESHGYGTRSSAIVHLRSPTSASSIAWADGPPCITPFVQRSDLVAALT